MTAITATGEWVVTNLYGGITLCGNTREGLAYAGRELTEHRLIAIHHPITDSGTPA